MCHTEFVHVNAGQEVQRPSISRRPLNAERQVRYSADVGGSWIRGADQMNGRGRKAHGQSPDIARGRSGRFAAKRAEGHTLSSAANAAQRLAAGPVSDLFARDRSLGDLRN